MKMKAWPVCPECGAKRVAVCRFCKTEGDGFPLAEMEFVMPHAVEGAAEDAEDRVTLEAQTRRYVPEHPAAAAEDDGVVIKPLLVGTLGVAYASEIRLETERCGCGHTGAEHAHGAGHDGAHGGCADHHAGGDCGSKYEMVKLKNPLDDVPEHDEKTQECALMVMCPECSELITPRFLNICQKCEHEFPDGVESRHRHHEAAEENVSRVVVAVVAMITVLGLLALGMMLPYLK